jgi:hypothetical protein
VTNYNTNYNVAYPVGTRPIGTQPATAYTILYNTNYNVEYPIATQPEASRPVTAYSTNYNVAYPIATQPEGNRPITSYVPGDAGAATTVLGVYFPGGAIGSPAPYVSDTVVQYWDYPDNSNYPVAVPPGGQIVVKIE